MIYFYFRTYIKGVVASPKFKNQHILCPRIKLNEYKQVVRIENDYKVMASSN